MHKPDGVESVVRGRIECDEEVREHPERVPRAHGGKHATEARSGGHGGPRGGAINAGRGKSRKVLCCGKATAGKTSSGRAARAYQHNNQHIYLPQMWLGQRVRGIKRYDYFLL